MNEKKAIVFFFVVVVFFFCFSFLFSAGGGGCFFDVRRHVRLSLVRLVFWLCLCVLLLLVVRFAHLRVCLLVCVCVCVSFNFHFLLLLLLLLFFSGASQFQTLPFLRTLFLLFRFYVVIRGGVFLHFFFSRIEQNTYTRAHVQTRTHRRTDGRREKSARAPLVLGSTHKLFCVFYCCVLLLLL